MLQALFDAFNSQNDVDEFKSIGLLPTGVKCPASYFSRFSTQYGEKIKCQLEVPQTLDSPAETVQVVIPSRFSMTDHQIEAFNALSDQGRPACLVYHGKRGAAFNISLAPQ